MKTIEKAREFIYRYARPLNLALWQYHFENGGTEAVLHALSFYQNEDGGFGYGIEADCLNPNSSPMSVWKATEVLNEINFTDKNHPIVKGILRYLESGADFDGGYNQWWNTVPTNNDYPHAFWWSYSENDDSKYNPTAALAGFIIRFADRDSEIYSKACDIAKQAIGWFNSSDVFGDEHIIGCFMTLFNCLAETGTELVDMKVFEQKLHENVNCAICRDTGKWDVEYVAKPSTFKIIRNSMFYEDNAELAEYECEHIINTQFPDGTWNVPWSWNEYPDEWAVSKNWWKSEIIIQNILYLKGFGKYT